MNERYFDEALTNAAVDALLFVAGFAALWFVLRFAVEVYYYIKRRRDWR
jgi:hypothetical protein